MRPSYRKFKNVRTELDGRSFSSALEASVYCLLKKDSRFVSLQCQKTIYLTKARIPYICDFSAVDITTGEEVFIEAKGIETPVWRIKLKLYRFYGPGTLYIYKGRAANPFLHETVKPQTSEST